MAFGTTSAIFRAWLADALGPTASFAGKIAATDTFKCALYGNTGTPDNNATAANTAYNAGAWVSGNELTSSTQWPAGGVALTFSSATRWHASDANLVWMDADDTAGSGNVNITSAYGDLVYDDSLTTPVADQGLAYHAFGTPQSVTAGTFTVVWNSNGVVRWTQNAA